MGTFSIWHWLVVLLVVVVLFGGRGKISQLMGDFAKGIKSFKKGLKEGEAEASDEEKPALRADETATVDATVHKDEAAKS